MVTEETKPYRFPWKQHAATLLHSVELELSRLLAPVLPSVATHKEAEVLLVSKSQDMDALCPCVKIR